LCHPVPGAIVAGDGLQSCRAKARSSEQDEIEILRSFPGPENDAGRCFAERARFVFESQCEEDRKEEKNKYGSEFLQDRSTYIRYLQTSKTCIIASVPGMHCSGEKAERTTAKRSKNVCGSQIHFVGEVKRVPEGL
jgi:hypothetical protein